MSNSPRGSIKRSDRPDMYGPMWYINNASNSSGMPTTPTKSGMPKLRRTAMYSSESQYLLWSAARTDTVVVSNSCVAALKNVSCGRRRKQDKTKKKKEKATRAAMNMRGTRMVSGGSQHTRWQRVVRDMVRARVVGWCEQAPLHSYSHAVSMRHLTDLVCHTVEHGQRARRQVGVQCEEHHAHRHGDPIHKRSSLNVTPNSPHQGRALA